MAAHALAPYVARSSAAMVLTIWDNQDLGFHWEGFAPPQCCELIQNVSKF